MRLANYARDVETGDPFTSGSVNILGPDGDSLASVALNGTTGRWFYEDNGQPGVTTQVYTGAGQTRQIAGDAYSQAGNWMLGEITELVQIFGDGVYGANPMPLSAPGGMSVRVGLGNMLILGTLLPVYVVEDLAIAASHATLARIDTIVGRLTRTGTFAGKAELAIKTGTAAASPAAPAVTQDADTWEVKLGQVAVAATAAAITTGNLSTTGRQYASLGAPAGSMSMYGGATAPTGWLLCDGSAVSRTTYAGLFGAIGTTFGVGDGSTTFNVPNFKGHFPVGRNAADANFNVLGETGGASDVTLTAAQSGLPSHDHDYAGHSHGSVDRVSGAGSAAAVVSGNPSTLTTDDTGGTAASASHENLPPYLVVNMIIRT